MAGLVDLLAEIHR